MQETLRNMLGKQFLITAYVEEKLQLVNYIKEGYDENKPILINNRFLHFTAHVYYRSIVEIIKKLRHQQIAHYDFSEKEEISLNFDKLWMLNKLYNLAVNIISFLGSEIKNVEDSMGFDFGRRHQKVDSLERLINKAKGI